jgi:rod shape-determining protein MreC
MRNSPVFKILLIAFIIIGAIFLNDHFLNNFWQNAFYEIFAEPGVFLVEKANKVSGYARVFFNKGSLVRENEELKKENRVLLGRLAELESLKRENDFLRNELKVAPRLSGKLLMAEIFDIQKNGLFSTILINKGKIDGVEKSMAVVTSGNILAGTVGEVFDKSALVLLVDDPRSVISIRFLESNILAEAKGGLGIGLKISQVSHLEEVKEGDIVVTSGLDGLTKSLPVGRVVKVESGGGLFKEVIAKPLFDLSLGSELFVILK